MNFMSKITRLILLIVFYVSFVNGQSQRSLFSWKRDLDFRLNSYLNKLDVINNIIATSIYPARGSLNEPTRISGSNVRFTNLIIPRGALILNSRVARPTVSILVNKTQNYFNLKTTELSQIKHQLDTFKRQLSDTDQRFIYKGTPNFISTQPVYVSGTRVFKQFLYGRLIDSASTILRKINYTDVDKVISDTYMENPGFGLRDHKSRLFFEGRKTFWKTVFRGPLNSGCCDRLRPLHTNRMMTRSRNQDIVAPVMFQTHNHLNREPIVIERLTTHHLSNRILAVGLMSNHPDDIGLIPSSQENIILPSSLVDIRQMRTVDLGSKTLIFKDTVGIENVLMPTTLTGGRTFISVSMKPEIIFDISHDNYLLRQLGMKNGALVQHLEGRLIVNSNARFFGNIDTMSLNNVNNFYQFATESIVRIDRPANISGLVQFNALPTILTSTRPAMSLQSFTILSVTGPLNVGLINGMRFPNDIVLLPRTPQETLNPIVVRGSRSFANQLIFQNVLEVKQLINNIQIPAGVIPLHLNDPINSLGYSNLVFLDGIIAGDVAIQSRMLGTLNLGEAHGNAQNLIMRSMIIAQPDGSHIINAPLHVTNLQLINREPNRGLLNGFRPENLLELYPNSPNYIQTIHGRKVFLAPVEVVDCIFNDINSIDNWTNHLIRIDRPNTVQTVHSRLAFLQPPLYVDPSNLINYPAPIANYNKTSSLDINHFRVEFLPNNDALNYMSNLELSPEFYVLHQALLRGIANRTEGRIRVNHLHLLNPQATVNGVALDDIITLETPFKFSDRFVMVGKVQVKGSLIANRVLSNYPIDSMDLVQFEKYRIPITNSLGPIRLNNLVLSTNNQASFVQCYMLNGIKFTEFANSIMSLTKPQVIESKLVFNAPVNLEGFARTGSSLNGIPNFKNFANDLKKATYSFEDGLMCNSVIIKT